MSDTYLKGRKKPIATTMRLIHYGASCYDPDKFKPISDVPFRNKPKGGLWTSPVVTQYGWREWCKEESYGRTEVSFEVIFSGRVLRINSVADMDALHWIDIDGIYFISFQAMCAGGFYYDAIHLTVKGQEETRFSHPKSLYGWDCETVFVMNPDSIQPLLREDKSEANYSIARPEEATHSQRLG